MMVSIVMTPIRPNPCILDIPTKRGARKYQEIPPIITVSKRFFMKNGISNPLEYIRVLLSDRYQIGIQESPTARAEPTTQKKCMRTIFSTTLNISPTKRIFTRS